MKIQTIHYQDKRSDRPHYARVLQNPRVRRNGVTVVKTKEALYLWLPTPTVITVRFWNTLSRCATATAAAARRRNARSIAVHGERFDATFQSSNFQDFNEISKYYIPL